MTWQWPFANAQKAWTLWSSHPGQTVLQAIVDVLFFIIFGFLTLPLFNKLTEHSIIISSLVSKNAASFTQQYAIKPSLLQIITSDPVMTPFLWKTLFLLALLAVITFLLYSLVQGVSWKIASAMVGRKDEWISFIVSFARISLPWFVLLLIYHMLTFFLDIRFRIAQNINPGLSLDISQYILYLFLIIIAYFAVVSYATGRAKNGLSLGVKRVGMFVPAFLFIVALGIAANLVSMIFARIHLGIGFVVSIILVLAFFSYSRIFVYAIGASGGKQ